VAFGLATAARLEAQARPAAAVEVIAIRNLFEASKIEPIFWL